MGLLTFSGPGASSEATMHSPLFQISPYFRKRFRTPWKFLPILPFPKKFFDFHPPKCLLTFFESLSTNFEFPPIFAASVHFPHYFAKNTISPLLLQISSLMFTYFLCFSFPPSLTMMHVWITQCTYWTRLFWPRFIRCTRRYANYFSTDGTWLSSMCILYLFKNHGFTIQLNVSVKTTTAHIQFNYCIWFYDLLYRSCQTTGDHKVPRSHYVGLTIVTHTLLGGTIIW